MTIAIFGAAVLALLFFLLGVIFKGLASVINGALESIAIVGGIGLAGGALLFVLYFVYFIANGIATKGLMSVITDIVMLIICLGLFIGLVGWIGEFAITIVYAALAIILGAISTSIEFLAEKCEKIYVHFLNVIIKQTDMS